MDGTCKNIDVKDINLVNELFTESKREIYCNSTTLYFSPVIDKMQVRKTALKRGEIYIHKCSCSGTHAELLYVHDNFYIATN